MANIVDELVITLGLDASQFTAGSVKIKDDLEQLKRESEDHGKKVEHSAGTATAAYAKLRNEVMALTALFVAGLGIKEFTTNTNIFNAATGQLAQNIGLTTEQLYLLEEGAKRFGGTSEATAGSLSGLMSELQQFSITGQSNLLPFFRTLHIDIGGLRDGTRSFYDIIIELHKALSKMTSTEATQWGKMFGLDPATVMLLRQSDEEFQKLIQHIKEIGVPTEKDIQLGQEFRGALADLEQASKMFGLTLLRDLNPEIIKVMKGIESWLQNKDNIKAVETWVLDVERAIKQVVDALGGWKSATEILFGLWAFSKISPLLANIGLITGAIFGVGATISGVTALWLAFLAALALTPESAPGAAARNKAGLYDQPQQPSLQNQWEQEHPGQKFSFGKMVGGAWQSAKDWMFGKDEDKHAAALRDTLSRDLGISKDAASGLVGGNLIPESNLNPNAVNPTSGALGLAQWLGPRKDALFEWAALNKLDPKKESTQLGFLEWELRNTFPDVLKALQDGRITPQQATNYVLHHYEKPGDQSPAEEQRRGDIARHVAALPSPEPTAPPWYHPTPASPTVPAVPRTTPVIPRPTPMPDPSLRLATIPRAQIMTSASNSVINTNTTSHAASNINNSTTIGSINIQTAETSPDGLAKGLKGALQRYQLAANANTGLV